MKILAFLFLTIFLSACSAVESSKANNLTNNEPVSTTQISNEINLTKIEHIAPKGRVQDGSLEDENFNTHPITKTILAKGKDSIPLLIEKLEDETKMKRQTIDFWYHVYVGDVSLIILNDLFTKSDGINSSIPGFSWDEFLERGGDDHLMGEEVLRRYIKKYGRAKIKERWQKVWDDNKDNIQWDKDEECFYIEDSK